MKKSLIYLTLAVFAASAVVSCQYGEDEISDAADKAATMSISIDKVEDEACTFTIAPASNASFYSYAVFNGKVSEVPVADDLYSCSLDNTIKKGTFCYADKSSAQVTLEGLEYNADYTIFAVAGSPTGNAGEVASLVFHTTDVVAPNAEEATVEDGNLVITFSEAVDYMNKSITVDVYAPSSLSYQNPWEPAEIVSTFVLSNGVADQYGASYSFAMPKDSFISGALLAVSYPAGTFMDAANNACEEMESIVFGNYYNDGWYYETLGLVVKTEAENFELGDAFSEVIDENCYAAFNLGAELGHYYYNSDGYIYRTIDWGADYAIGSMLFTQENEEGRVSTLEVELPSAYDYSSSCYDFNLDEEGNAFGVVYIIGVTPIPGDSIFVNIPEYAFVDIYNRPNAEKTYKFLYSPSESEGDTEVLGTNSVGHIPHTYQVNFKRSSK